jgi:hypothetical protein
VKGQAATTRAEALTTATAALTRAEMRTAPTTALRRRSRYVLQARLFGCGEGEQFACGVNGAFSPAPFSKPLTCRGCGTSLDRTTRKNDEVWAAAPGVEPTMARRAGPGPSLTVSDGNVGSKQSIKKRPGSAEKPDRDARREVRTDIGTCSAQ